MEGNEGRERRERKKKEMREGKEGKERRREWKRDRMGWYIGKEERNQKCMKKPK